MLCQKKRKKKVSPASQNGRNKKKIKKKPSNQVSL